MLFLPWSMRCCRRLEGRMEQRMGQGHKAGNLPSDGFPATTNWFAFSSSACSHFLVHTRWEQKHWEFPEPQQRGLDFFPSPHNLHFYFLFALHFIELFPSNSKENVGCWYLDIALVRNESWTLRGPSKLTRSCLSRKLALLDASLLNTRGLMQNSSRRRINSQFLASFHWCSCLILNLW